MKVVIILRKDRGRNRCRTRTHSNQMLDSFKADEKKEGNESEKILNLFTKEKKLSLSAYE